MNQNGHLAKSVENLSDHDQLNKFLRKTRPTPYELVVVDLNSTRSNYEVNLAGDALYILDATDTTANVKVRFNEIQNAEVTLTKQLGARTPFYRFFLTHSQQATKTITLLIFTSRLFEVLDARPGAGGGGGGGGVDPVRIHDGVDIMSINADGSALTDPKDRAARLLGVIYGNLDKLQQRSASFDLLVQLRSGGVEIDPRAITSLPSLPAGTNNIGDVDVLTMPALPAGANNIGDVDVLTMPALPAGANNIGDVDVVSQSSGKTIKRAVISASASGNNTLVAAVLSNKIKVLSVLLIAAAAVDVKFQSGAAGTDLTGLISLDAKAGFVLPAPATPDNHWIETAVNTLLNLSLSAAVQVSGCMTYYEEA